MSNTLMAANNKYSSNNDVLIISLALHGDSSFTLDAAGWEGERERGRDRERGGERERGERCWLGGQ